MTASSQGWARTGHGAAFTSGYYCRRSRGIRGSDESLMGGTGCHRAACAGCHGQTHLDCLLIQTVRPLGRGNVVAIALSMSSAWPLAKVRKTADALGLRLCRGSGEQRLRRSFTSSG
jgi:hypothetical protein